MRPFGVLEAVAAPMLDANIDTDRIIPSREMRTTGKTGLADGLFANLRYRDPAARVPDPAFVLNRPEYAGAQMLIAGANFGAGSSREHAVWALVEYGIRAVIAPGFSPIFAGNATRNGLLCVTLAEAEVRAIAAWVAADPGRRRVAIDLPAQTVRAGASYRFAIAAEPKAMLIAGADALTLTLAELPAIIAWQARDRSARPWVYEVVRG